MIEELLANISPSRAALGLGLGLFILFWVLKFRAARRIHLLGGKSPEIPTYLPVGKYSSPFLTDEKSTLIRLSYSRRLHLCFDTISQTTQRA